MFLHQPSASEKSLRFCLFLISSCRLKWVFTAYDEMMQSWCCAEDLESFEHVAMESVTFVVGAVSRRFRFPSNSEVYASASLIYPGL